MCVSNTTATLTTPSPPSRKLSLHGSRPPDAPTRHVTPHIWYEQRGKMRYDNRSYHDSFVLLLLLPLVAILPANIRDYS